MDVSVSLLEAGLEFTNVRLYQAMVGSLNYLVTGTRPALAYSVGVLARYMSKPRMLHFAMMKRVLRYVKGTLEQGLNLGGNDVKLTGYSDANWAGDLETRRSTTGFLYDIGNSLVSWKSKRQPTVALSSAESEYMALAAATQEGIWCRAVLNELGEKQEGPLIIYQDNQGTIAMANNPVQHGRTKHIDLRHHFIRECIQKGEIILSYLSTDQMKADILTKALGKPRFESLIKLIHMGNDRLNHCPWGCVERKSNTGMVKRLDMVELAC
jgi:hypothetical protein